MYIKDNNLVIRSATVDDSILIFKWWNDGKIMEHAGFPNGLNATLDSVSKAILRNSEKSQLLIIEFNDIPVGEMNYRTVSEGIAEIGIKICDFSKQEMGLGSKI